MDLSPPPRGEETGQDGFPLRLRPVWLLAVLLCAYGFLAGRLAILQMPIPGATADPVADGMQGERAMLARRGTLYDSAGRELAVSVRVHGCAVDPELTPDLTLTLASLSGVLPFTVSEAEGILGQVTALRLEGKRPRFVWIRKRLTAAEAEVIEGLHLPGVILTDGWERAYPQDSLACHALGFTDVYEHGLEGLERVLDSELRSEPAAVGVLRDARRGMILESADRIREGKEGRDACLSIDAVIQRLTERVLARVYEERHARSASAIVMDPYTGDILAMANCPAYDLNDARRSDPALRLNPSIAAIYEPGSVFKPFIFAAALETGVVDESTPFDCENGAWNLGYRILHDAHPYGSLTAAMVVVKSSNIGIAKIAARVGMEKLYRYLYAFGFGQKTGVGLDGELPGLFRPLAEWNPRFSMTSIPMGQEISVTPLQLAASFSAIVNGGMLLRPRLVREFRSDSGEIERIPVRPVRRVVSEQTALRVRAVLQRVVEEGTGRTARIAEFSTGGKTGTAQIAGPGGYQEKKYIATFCGFAPAEAPRLLCLVSVSEPQGQYYGGQVSAPAVAQILRESLLYLGVPPRTSASSLALRAADE